MIKLITVLVALVFVIGSPMLLNAQNRYFYGEDRFKVQSPMSVSVQNAVRKDKNLRDCLPIPVDFSSDRFEATAINLNRSSSRKLLVKGECGNSATSYYFWILSKMGKRYEPIFFAAAMGVEIQKTNLRGYPDILASGCNANTCFYELFAFDGRKYNRKSSWEKSVR